MEHEHEFTPRPNGGAVCGVMRMRVSAHVSMQLPVLRSFACIAAAAVLAMTPVPPPSMISSAHAAAPSAEAQAGLRRAFTAAQAGLGSADALFGLSITEWEKTAQPTEEIAALYKARGGLRSEQEQLPGALADLSKALELMRQSIGQADVAELQRTYQLRARVNGALGKRPEQIADLSAAIDLLDKMDAIEATNPYVYAERCKARMIVGDFAGAASDAEIAEVLFKQTGDKIRRTLAVADGALASYGAGDVEVGVEKMRFVFRTKRSLATSNPDDIALLQELSRRDAELHIAYAAHLYSSQARLIDASRQWESGCVRLETYVVDGTSRFEEEQRLRQSEAALSEASGKAEVQSPMDAHAVRTGLCMHTCFPSTTYDMWQCAQVLRAESVRTPFAVIDDLRALATGLDPKSPVVTQRAGSSYFWYKTSEGEVERRDAGNPLQSREDSVAIGLSCTAFRDSAWVGRYRPEWPRNLVEQLERFVADVEQPAIPLPPKGTPPTRGEIEF